MCSDRIAENEMVDGMDTVIDFCDFPDILFTSEGLFDCRHILESYLPVDSGVGRKVKEALTDLYVRVKFRGIFDIIRNAAESHG